MKSNELFFSVKAGIKNIVGKDLIADDNIAIFELVKNSYDAYASKVIITFEDNKIIIADDGKGMSIDDIEKKYGLDYGRYSETIRKASLLYRYLLKNDTILINTKTYNISVKDRLHILVSGFLYTLRNDIMHGSSISITKSSKTTLGTYAIDYFGFLLKYYLLLFLILNKFSSEYPSDVYDKLSNNIELNMNLYDEIFGKEIEK